MSDLIDRQAAIVRALKVIKDDDLAHDVKEAIKALPSAEPDSRLKGELIYRENGADIAECSICHHKFYWVSSKIGMLNFCPSCGAEMRGEQDEG